MALTVQIPNNGSDRKTSNYLTVEGTPKALVFTIYDNTEYAKVSTIRLDFNSAARILVYVYKWVKGRR